MLAFRNTRRKIPFGNFHDARTHYQRSLTASYINRLLSYSSDKQACNNYDSLQFWIVFN